MPGRNIEDPMSRYLGVYTTERDPVDENKAQRQEVIPHPHPNLSQHLRQVSLGQGRQCGSQYTKDPCPFRTTKGKDNVLLN